jgi:hypothetical protein
MRKLTMVAAVFIAMGISSVAPATPYHFILEGTVTSGDWPDVFDGDPFSMAYVGYPEDLDPSPTVGRYSVSTALVSFPHTTIDSYTPATFKVLLPGSDGTDDVIYSTFSFNYQFSARFRFSAGTLPSDAMPLTLPLESALEADLFIYSLGEGIVSGTFTSYSTLEAPEPSGVVALGIAIVAAWSRRSRLTSRAPGALRATTSSG